MTTRPIKFRAWDIYLKRFRDEMDYVVDPETGLPHWIHDNEYLQGVAEQLILNQFTGLLDKNGKEVYEKDIIKSDWGYDGIVDFKSIIFAEIECTISENIEVIGNIYQNFHLLP